MSLEKFTSLIADEFQEIDPSLITADADLEEIIPMSSLNVILIMAIVKVEYGIDLDVKELKTCTSIRDVYEKCIINK